MIYYFVGLFLMFSYMYSETKLPRLATKDTLLKIEIVLLIFFAGLRSVNVGTDTLVYCRVFESVANGGCFEEGERFEIGYKIFIRIVALITNNPHVFIFVTSTVIYVGIWYFIKNNSEIPLLSLLLFYLIFFCNSLNISRQYMGIAFAINSLTYIKQKRYIRAIFLIVLGTTIHTVSLIFLIVFVISFFKKSNKGIIMLILSVAIALVFSGSIIKIIIKVFPSYSFYFTHALFENDGNIGKLTILMLFLTLWAIIKNGNKHLIYSRTETVADEINVNILVIEMMIIACSIGVLASKFVMLDRISEMLNIFCILLIPNITKGRNRFLYETIIVLIFTYYMYVVINFGGIGVAPYSILV